MAEKSYIDAIHDALVEEMDRLPDMVVLGEDIQEGGVFRVTDGMLERYGPQRVLDTPLAESSIVGIAIGLATNGCNPVAEIQFADFAFPAFNQLISEAARWRYRSNNGWGCPIVVRAPFGAGIRGALYHSQSIEAMLAHVPGLKVVVPSTPYDAKGLLKAAIRDPDPVVYFEHKKAYRAVKGEVPDGDYTVPIGEAALRREGDDLTVISYGLMAHECLQAAEELSGEGIEATVLDLRTLAPLDREAILEAARRTGKILIVHEDNLTIGIGAEVAALIAEHAFDALDAPIRRLAAPDVPAMPFNAAGEDFCLPSREKIAAAMRQLAAY
ncbi:MAG TPA: alpha-ketoacid dehydrogenase subunit beta [Dehalococcoidia bacterium]|nr:alpha-ketoacid dehydrogenase subunit beta [Dehalococcoidia bacterium]